MKTHPLLLGLAAIGAIAIIYKIAEPPAPETGIRKLARDTWLSAVNGAANGAATVLMTRS